MKKPKWFRTIQEYLSEKHYRRSVELASIKKVLKTLRKHRDELRRRLSTEECPKRSRHIQKALKVVHAQRKKGVKALKRLRKSEND